MSFFRLQGLRVEAVEGYVELSRGHENMMTLFRKEVDMGKL